MNPCNPVTVPLAFMQAMMTSMQAQPPNQLQSVGGLPNVAVHGTGQAMPQQAGFPTFFLQTPQMQTFPGPSAFSVQQPSAGQPWVLPALQTVNAQAPQPSGFQSAGAAATQPSVKEITAGVVTAMKSTPQDTVRDKSIAIGYVPDDERVLVNALRNAKAEGLTPLQGFSKLDKIHNHSTAAWKDYFLEHVERLSPKVYPQAYTKISASASSTSSAGGSRSTTTSGGPSASPALSRHPTSGEAAASGFEQRTRDEGISTSYRSKRGAPVEEYHEELCIPFLPPGTKPKTPRRGPRDDSPKFTEEEKIFFIHFLKYRLHRGPVPSKEQLCKELAEQTPHHNAGSWKRHWDKACKLPNEIYIQARKRVQSDLQGPLPAPPSRASGSHRAELSDEQDEQEEADAEPSDDPEYEPTASRIPSSTTTKGTKQRGVRKYKITEGDIRAMAQYVVDKRKSDDGWEHLAAPVRWEEFAARPKNRKRQAKAWAQIEYKRAKEIDTYIQEYEEEQAPPADEEILDPSMTDKSSDSQSKVEGMKGTKLAGKRALENEEEPGFEGSVSLTQKRPRLDEPAGI